MSNEQASGELVDLICEFISAKKFSHSESEIILERAVSSIKQALQILRHLEATRK